MKNRKNMIILLLVILGFIVIIGGVILSTNVFHMDNVFDNTEEGETLSKREALEILKTKFSFVQDLIYGA